MKKAEIIPITAAAALVFVALLIVAIQSLPIMRVERIESVNAPMTPSLSRMLSSSLGVSYPGLSRHALIREIESLPYISNPSVSYGNGTLFLNAEAENGALLMTKEKAYFQSGSSLSEISLEDAGALSSVYPVIGVNETELSEAEWEYLDTALSALVSRPYSSRLISWIEYVNNIEDGPDELRIALPLLNASISAKDPSFLERLEESIGIIEEENSKKPGCTIFSPSSEYELYSDKLIRTKG